ncbi:hypothetical protein K439DRAFT_774844 [Ramaria rubella]|nr:hypothetical protein K439DRAFT_774844 [Ramaria rubella]
MTTVPTLPTGQDVAPPLPHKNIRKIDLIREDKNGIIRRLRTQTARVVLPKFVTIMDHERRYLSVWGVHGLKYEKVVVDKDCIFEVVESADDKIKLKGSRGFVAAAAIYWSGSESWATMFCAETITEENALALGIIHLVDNFLYFTVEGLPYQEQVFFKTNESLTGGVSGLQTELLVARGIYVTASERFEIGEPIINKQILDVNYDIPGAVISPEPPFIALSTTVRNDSTSSETKQTLHYSYTKSVVGTWNNAVGLEIGTRVTFKAGVPFIASTEAEISVTASAEHQWGGSIGEEVTISSSTEITVPPGKKGSALVLVRRGNLDVYFSYILRVLYTNGETHDTSKRGIYNNVDSYHVDVTVGDWEEI